MKMDKKHMTTLDISLATSDTLLALPSLDAMIEEVPAADLDDITGGEKPTQPPKSNCTSVTCGETTVTIKISL
jgi:hypothetical protein